MQRVRFFDHSSFQTSSQRKAIVRMSNHHVVSSLSTCSRQARIPIEKLIMLPTSPFTPSRRLAPGTDVAKPILADSHQTSIGHCHGARGIDIAARAANRHDTLLSPSSIVQRPALSINVDADVDDVKAEKLGGITFLPGDTQNPLIEPCTDRYIDYLRRSIRDLVSTVHAYSHGGTVVCFSDLIDDPADLEDIYTRYMTGQLNGRLGRADLSHLCDLLRQIGYLTPKLYISPALRRLTTTLVTGSSRPDTGVGTLRFQAIRQFDAVLAKVGSINAGPDSGEVKQILVDRMHSRFSASELLLHVQQGDTAEVLLMLCMGNLHANPGINVAVLEKAFVKAMSKGYEDIAMHFLLYIESSDEAIRPERLNGLLRWFLDANAAVHADLIWQLVAMGADPNTKGSATGDTALHVACKNNHPRLVNFLLDQRASPVLANAKGQLAIDQTSRPGARRVYVPTKFTWDR